MILISALILVSSLYLLIKILQYLKWRNHMDKVTQNINGPKNHPIFGVGLDLMKAKDIFDYREYVYENFTSPIKAWMGPIHMLVVISDPKSIKKVLTSYETLNKSSFYSFIGLGETIFSNPREKWRHQRKCTNALLQNKKYADSCYPTVAKTALKFVNSLMKRVDGAEFDIFNHIGAYVVELVFKVFFDSDYEALENPHENEVIIKTERTNEVRVKRMFTLPLYLDFIYRFSKLYKLEQENNLNNFYEKLIEEKAQDVFDPIKMLSPNGGLARVLLKAEDYNPIEARDSFRGVVFAAFDTTSSMVSKALLLLAMHPEIQDKLYEEIREAVTRDDDVKDFSIIKSLTYLDLICKESLRFFPSVPFLGRMASEDFKLNEEQTIPAGTHILIDIFKMHRDPAYWGDDVDQFIPERFLPERIKNVDPNAYIPFSAGSRNCQGYLFAEMFYKAALALIIRNFEIKTEVKLDEIEYDYALTLKFREEAKISLKKRLS